MLVRNAMMKNAVKRRWFDDFQK